MEKLNKLNLFYEEPDPDRWFKYDRYPRKLIRRIVRGKTRPGGVMMVALELMKGLDLLKVSYRFNDYKYARKHPNELIGVIGKPHLIFEKRFKNPILFGAGIFSHPIEAPTLFQTYPNVKHILVPGQWMKDMFEPFYCSRVTAWPVGIDSYKWNPSIKKEKKYDFLIYDKIRWHHEKLQNELINPIIEQLQDLQLSYTIIKYGNYTHTDLLEKLAVASAAIFLCEHESQGIAYQQILATGTPILAFDEEGLWKDPYYYPEKVKFGPVTSVPYWDDNCGMKFKDVATFRKNLPIFLEKLKQNNFNPAKFIEDNLTLEKCALAYVDIYQRLAKEIQQ